MQKNVKLQIANCKNAKNANCKMTKIAKQPIAIANCKQGNREQGEGNIVEDLTRMGQGPANTCI